MRIGEVSFWYADMGGLPPRRPPLAGDTTADVCIVGAGYTGLWAAWYLKRHDPGLDVLVVEKEFAGFGASGRNGGWLTGGFAWRHDRYLPQGGREGVRAMIRALLGTVDEVIAVAEAEEIDADIRRTDELIVALNPAQEARLHAELAHRQSWDVPEDRVRLIGAAEARSRIDLPGLCAALVIEGVARIQPAKLVRGLAAAVERRGVRIAEGTVVTALSPGRVVTTHGTVRAGVVLRCTEGFTATLPGERRTWLPLNSAQVVTEPLPPELWARIGWQGCELVEDGAHSYFYAQRTREGRIAFGGRGVPYRLGSRIDAAGTPDPETVRRLVARLHAVFPALRDVPVAHAWCGVLGVPRDWCATVGYDPVARMGFAGGYVGVGVSTSNLAGRTLADLALGRETELVRLPWVNRPVRRWEPEPLRWLGVHGLYWLLTAADRREAASASARSSALARIGKAIAGR
jgi:glycine/D-amino acid oxidase-like deaminating enzyme